MRTRGVRGTGGKREEKAGGKELRCLVGSFGVSPYQMVRQLAGSIGDRHTKEKGEGGRRGEDGVKEEVFWTDGRG